MDSSQTIIVKKIKKGGHGHHGGAWKVAFADFVTAMMAFFLLMWLLGSTTPEQRQAISDYFENPSAVQGPGGASTSMIKLGAVDADLKEKTPEETPQEVKEVEKPVRDAESEKETLANLKDDLEAKIKASEALQKFKDQLLLDITPEGLRIQIIDKENRPMFSSGSSHLQDYAKQILKEIAPVIGKVPNKISLTGHTDATPFRNMLGYTNWELSTDRANASRRELVVGGLKEEKVAKVVGLSSTVLFDAQNPNNPVNRRISIIVMNKQAEEAIMREAKAADVNDVRQSIGTTPAPASLQQKPKPSLLGAPPESPAPQSLKPKSLAPKSLGAKPQTLSSGKESPKALKPTTLPNSQRSNALINPIQLPPPVPNQ